MNVDHAKGNLLPSSSPPPPPSSLPANSKGSMSAERKKTLKWICIGALLYTFIIQMSSFEASFYRREMTYEYDNNIVQNSHMPAIPSSAAANQNVQHVQHGSNDHSQEIVSSDSGSNDPVALQVPVAPVSSDTPEVKVQAPVDVSNGSSNEGVNEEDFESKWTCYWSIEAHDECNQVLARRLPQPIQPMQGEGPTKQRWLFFGDSTMKRPFQKSNLNRYLVEEPFIFQNEARKDESGNDGKFACWTDIDCTERHVDRCDHDTVFEMERVPEAEYQSPVWDSFEGPTNWAVGKPYCSDCGGCDPHFLHCVSTTAAAKSQIDGDSEQPQQEQKNCNLNSLAYGGFMKIEFAKDVEVQSSLYKTTQENTAHYLREHFNSPQMAMEWGKPICVIGTGFHDMILLLKTDNFNQGRFVENVNWYLMIMKDECSHIIWLSNTAPSRENPRNWPQTMELTKAWNDGVRDMIELIPDLKEMMTYIDVYEATVDYPHNADDHIHLIDAWYGEIGLWFSSIIRRYDL